MRDESGQRVGEAAGNMSAKLLDKIKPIGESDEKSPGVTSPQNDQSRVRLTTEEAMSPFEFLKGCFRYNPIERPSAEELLKHIWLNGQL